MIIDNFKVEEWFNKYEHKAVYDLADTCVNCMSVNELLELTGEGLDTICNRKLNYGDIHGSERLKNAITTLYKTQQGKNITITHGTIGANHLVMISLIEPGDKVVSILPAYQQHYSIPKSIGADVKTLFLKEKNSWLPDLDELEKITGNNTKIICMTNPNNPTGAVIPDGMLKKIVKIAQKSNAYILCDEVYRGLNHSGNPFSVSISDIYEKGISTGSVSKVFSLAGLRLGWICADENIIKIINRQREYNTISVGILDDYFAAAAIENKDIIIKRNLENIRTGKKILTDWLQKENRIHCVLPQGGTTAFAGYDFEISSEELCSRFQNDTGVMILPGSTLEVEKYLRIGIGNNFKNLKTGLEKFSGWLDNKF